LEIPTIETSRLRLRGYRADDFPRSAALWSDPLVILHTTGRPLTPEEAWGKTLRNAGLWAVLGYGYWAVDEKAGGEYVGEVGFADFRRDVQPSIAGAPELGYVFRAPVHGKGYATEAVRAAIAWLDQNVAPQRSVCIIQTENAASIHVAEKCGYREFDRSQYKGNHVIMLERRR
jgi:RimJ/RimL family protein N-acetyltransferase